MLCDAGTGLLRYRELVRCGFFVFAAPFVTVTWALRRDLMNFIDSFEERPVETGSFHFWRTFILWTFLLEFSVSLWFSVLIL